MKLLEGFRVLDMSRLIPGPLATMFLADLGADVIKVEDPKVGDYFRLSGEESHGGWRTAFVYLNRNKRSVTADFKTEEGRKVVYDLAKTSDAFIEGARPGSTAKLGFGYDVLKAINSRIVYCSLTGFGQTGPFAQLATHGGAYDAVTGVAVPRQIKDGSFVQYRPYPHIGTTSGPWLAVMAMLAALLRAQRTGEGAYIDISCADASLVALDREIEPVLNGDHRGWPDPEENVSVKYCYYKTKDDRFMLIQAIEQHFWEHFCETVGRPDLKGRGEWGASRMDSSSGDAELRQELIGLFRTRTQAEWTQHFLDNNIAGAPYYPLDEVAHTELFRSREMIVEQEHPAAGNVSMVGSAIKIEGEAFEIARPAPALGGDTKEVLAELGYSDQEIRSLKDRGLV